MSATTTTNAYEFLVERNTEGGIVYLAISKGSVEELSTVYDSNGQQISPETNGDWLTILTSKVSEVLGKLKEEDSDLEDLDLGLLGVYKDVMSYENSELYDLISGNSELEDGVDYEKNIPWTYGYNYHDGHNWQSVTTDSEQWADHCSHFLINDEDLENELNKAIDEMEFIEEVHGVRYFETENFKIEQSQWQGSFECYSVSKK
jgi:hypothetical protein